MIRKENYAKEALEAVANAISECSGMRFDGFWTRVEDLEPEDLEYALTEAQAALEAAAPWLRAQALEDAADDLDGEFAQIRAAQEKPFTWLCGIADAELHLRARAATERGEA